MPTTPTWTLPAPISAPVVASIARIYQVHPLVARILLARGLVDQQIGRYLHPDLADLHDPRLLSGIEDAVRVLDEAIRSGRKITVYGDYDVDGTTAAAAVVSYVRSRGGDADYFIPNRREGYGLRRESLDKIIERSRPELLITVDCGTNSKDEVEYALSRGLSVIVTDHHEPEPRKIAPGIVINPHLADDAYPFKSLAGVGVAYKLIAAHYGRHPTSNLDLVALGTVADVMELTDENRVLVTYGLQRLSQTKRVGMQALISTLRLKADRRASLTASDISFRLGPRINAVGRMDWDPALVVELLLTEDDHRAKELAAILDRKNTERQEQTDRLAAEAFSQVGDERFIVVQLDLFSGMAGLVASKLVSEFGRPAIVLDLQGRGSGRSVAGLNLIETVKATGIGWARGHKAACGVGDVTDANALRAALNALPMPEIEAPTLTIDASCSLSDITAETLAGLDRLEPTGAGNPSPILLVSSVRVVGVAMKGRRQQHASIVLRDDSGVERRAIWFGAGDRAPSVGSMVDVAFSPSWDDFSCGPQLEVKGLRVLDAQPRSDA